MVYLELKKRPNGKEYPYLTKCIRTGPHSNKKIRKYIGIGLNNSNLYKKIKSLIPHINKFEKDNKLEKSSFKNIKNIIAPEYREFSNFGLDKEFDFYNPTYAEFEDELNNINKRDIKQLKDNYNFIEIKKKSDFKILDSGGSYIPEMALYDYTLIFKSPVFDIKDLNKIKRYFETTFNEGTYLKNSIISNYDNGYLMDYRISKSKRLYYVLNKISKKYQFVGSCGKSSNHDQFKYIKKDLKPFAEGSIGLLY
ncbi:MAG: hypothetical protein HRU03_01575 [Nanoarchaeales archaeon]|nr:hypothetical protein [Nanoarchaeales archaeon]